MGFGFPDSISDYGLKEWLRLVVIVFGYLIIRPHISKLMEMTQKKQNNRQAAEQAEAEAEKLIEDPDKPKSAESSSSTQTWRWGHKATKRASKKTNKPKTKQQIAEEMDSDEDVSDLLQFDDESNNLD